MMKKWILTLVAMVLLTVSVMATNVVDYADLYSQDQEDALNETALALTKSIGSDVVILTTDEYYEGSRDYYVEDIYADLGFTPDGILLHIDMANRIVAAQAFGEYQTIIDPDDRDELYSYAQKELANGDFYGGAEIFLEKIPAAIDGTIAFNLSGVEVLVMVILTVATFCGIFFGVKSSYGKEGKEKPYPFGEKADLSLSVNRDELVREYTTRVHSPRNNGGSGGGSSRSSGRSSSSSSGRF